MVFPIMDQINHKHRSTVPLSLIWLCMHPWHVTYSCYRNITKLLCSCHSCGNVNIWRANVVSSQEMNTDIRGELASSITWTTTIFGLSFDVMEPTWLQCTMSSVWAQGECTKGNERWLIVRLCFVAKEASSKISMLFKIPQKKTLISLFKVSCQIWQS